MNAKKRNDIVEAVSGIVGATAIVGLIWLVYTGHTTFGEITPILIGIVSAAGVYESGRRRGKKAQALETMFEMAEEFMGGDSEQSSSESSATSSTSSSGTSGNPGGREEPPSAEGEHFAPKDSNASSESSGSDGSEYDESDLGVSATDDAMSMVATTPYSDLQRIGGYLDGVNGSGNDGRPLRQQLEAVAEKRPQDIVDAYDAVMNSNDTNQSKTPTKK